MTVTPHHVLHDSVVDGFSITAHSKLFCFSFKVTVVTVRVEELKKQRVDSHNWLTQIRQLNDLSYLTFKNNLSTITFLCLVSVKVRGHTYCIL